MSAANEPVPTPNDALADADAIAETMDTKGDAYRVGFGNGYAAALRHGTLSGAPHEPKRCEHGKTELGTHIIAGARTKPFYCAGRAPDEPKRCCEAFEQPCQDCPGPAPDGEVPQSLTDARIEAKAWALFPAVGAHAQPDSRWHDFVSAAKWARDYRASQDAMPGELEIEWEAVHRSRDERSEFAMGFCVGARWARDYAIPAALRTMKGADRG